MKRNLTMEKSEKSKKGKRLGCKEDKGEKIHINEGKSSDSLLLIVFFNPESIILLTH
jgi:hypothetical protein